MKHTVLTVPGLRGSGPAHWQSLWEARHPAYIRVQQADWNEPRLAEWTRTLDGAIRAARRPVVVAAHSFGCLAAIHRVAERADGVAGLLLVAPASPQKFGLEEALRVTRLAVPSILVASVNDPWLRFDEAARLATKLGSSFINAGAAGHINAESGHGEWPEGEELLKRVVSLGERRFSEALV